MPDTHKIPTDEWNAHKSQIRHLYITENKALGQVIESLANDYHFRPTKAQYIRHLKKWGFVKNSTGEQWKSIAKEKRKRESCGKATEVLVKGKAVSSPKLRKEIARYGVASEDEDRSAVSLEKRDFVVHTPRERLERPIEYLHIPWLKFQALIEPYLGYLRGPETHENTPAYSFDDSQDDMDHDMPAFQPGNLTTDQMDLSEDWSEPQVANNLRPQWYDFREQGHMSPNQLVDTKSMMAWRKESRGEVLALMTLGADEARGILYDKNQQNVMSHLDDLKVEEHDESIEPYMAALSNLSNTESAIQLLRFSVYLASNNLCSTKSIDWLVDCVNRMSSQWVLSVLLSPKTPTTQIFGEHLLIGAARNGFTSTVRKLLAEGVNVDALARQPMPVTALQEAVKCDQLQVVRMLLDSGADPAPQRGSLHSLLRDALNSKDSNDMFQMLIDKGADVNGPYDELNHFYDKSHYRGPVLASAASKCDCAMIRILLKAGSNVNGTRNGSTTALQRATSSSNIEVAQLLIDSGADIDYPTEGAVDEIHHTLSLQNLNVLQTPIQQASEANSIELVQLLVSKGVNVNACHESITHKLESKFEHCAANFHLTALQGATKNENFVIVRILLGAGANVDKRGCEYSFPSDKDKRGFQTWEGDTPLQIAACLGNVKIAMTLLEHGADVNAPASSCGNGRTALQAAASKGCYGLVQQLMDAGACVNAAAGRNYGKTALQAAVASGNTELVELLFQSGANINACASEVGGRTCLQAAVEKGYSKLVRWLLEKGAEVNSPAASEYDGVTALQAALAYLEPDEYSRHENLNLLLEAGADVNAPGSPEWGITAIEAAIRTRDLELVSLLLQRGADPSLRTQKTTAIGAAIEEDSVEMVSLLIKSGADINAMYQFYEDKIPRSGTALQAAAWKGNMTFVELLVDAGAEIDHGSPSAEMAALQYAVKNGHTTIVKFLIAKSADPNAYSVDKYFDMYSTALVKACSDWDIDSDKINTDIMTMLIEAGADVNGFPSYNRRMPLCGAVSAGSIEAVQLLLAAGADVNAPGPGNYNRIPLQTAAEEGHIAIVQLLLSNGANVNAPAENRGFSKTALQAATRNGDLKMCLILMEAGADINAPAADKYGGTALQGAAMFGHLKICLILLEAGANINAPAADLYGVTALQGAARNGHLKICLILMEAGANINAPAADSSGATALQGAAMGGHLKICLILMEAGANINAPGASEHGRTALNGAAENGRLDIIHLLLHNDPDVEGLPGRCQRAAKYAAKRGHRIIANILREYKATPRSHGGA